jgi:hypothetical protein
MKTLSRSKSALQIAEQVEGKVANYTATVSLWLLSLADVDHIRMPFNAAIGRDLLKAQREGVE